MKYAQINSIDMFLRVAAKPRSNLPFLFPPQKTCRKSITIGPPSAQDLHCLSFDKIPAGGRLTNPGLCLPLIYTRWSATKVKREQKSLPGGLAPTWPSDRFCQVSKWGHMVSQMWCNNMLNGVSKAGVKEHETPHCDRFLSQFRALIRRNGFTHNRPSTKTLWSRMKTKVSIRLQQ